MSSRYRAVLDEAGAFYNKGRYHDAAVTFEQARRIALDSMMPAEAFEAGVWAAISWRLTGYFTRAFGLFLELLRDEPDAANIVYERWFARTEIFTISEQNRPDLPKQEARLDNLRQFQQEHPSLPEADVYEFTGMLLSDQGRWAEALEQYELAWAKDKDGFGYVKWRKAVQAANFNLRLGHLEAAQRWCRQLGQTDTNYLESRIDWFVLQSDLARYQGEWAAAEEHAAEAEAKSDQVQGSGNPALDSRVRALLLQSSHGDPCQTHHPAHFRLRQKPRLPLNVFGKSNRWFLLADFRLAALRYLLGIPPVDDQWYQQPQQMPAALPASFNESAFRQRVNLTRRAIHRVTKQAVYLDNVFRCDWRQAEVAQRQARLDEIIQFVTQSMR